jgi:hypothetical protein
VAFFYKNKVIENFVSNEKFFCPQWKELKDIGYDCCCVSSKGGACCV